MSRELEKDLKWESGILAFFYRQLLVGRPKSLPTSGTHLKDQTAIVTGSNVGLGLEASRQFLQLGLHQLILAVRSQEKGDAAATGLRDEFPAADIKVWILDMESYDSIVAFAKRCEQELQRIDIAILNAGLMMSNFQASKFTGHEVVFQVNFLSTALLAIFLLPILKAKREPLRSTAEGKLGPAPARLSIITSDTHYWSTLNTEYPQMLKRGPILPQFDHPEGYSMMLGYQRSKVLVTMFVEELAERVDHHDVIINSVGPGLTKGTSILRDTVGLFLRAVHAIVGATVPRTVEIGASTYIDGTVWKDKESHGSYLAEWTYKP